MFSVFKVAYTLLPVPSLSVRILINVNTVAVEITRILLTTHCMWRNHNHKCIRLCRRWAIADA